MPDPKSLLSRYRSLPAESRAKIVRYLAKHDVEQRLNQTLLSRNQTVIHHLHDEKYADCVDDMADHINDHSCLERADAYTLCAADDDMFLHLYEYSCMKCINVGILSDRIWLDQCAKLDEFKALCDKQLALQQAMADLPADAYTESHKLKYELSILHDELLAVRQTADDAMRRSIRYRTIVEIYDEYAMLALEAIGLTSVKYLFADD